MQIQNKDVYFQSDISLPSLVYKSSDFSFSLCGTGTPTFPEQHFLLGSLMAHILSHDQRGAGISEIQPKSSLPRDPSMFGGLVTVATLYFNSISVQPVPVQLHRWGKMGKIGANGLAPHPCKNPPSYKVRFQRCLGQRPVTANLISEG